MQTLATYELGTRHITVQRLRQLTLLLGESMLELLARAQAEVDKPVPGEQITIELHAAAELPGQHLIPLRGWARSCLSAEPNHSTARLGLDAQARLAELCDLTADELIEALIPALET